MGFMTTITVKNPRRRPMNEPEGRAAWAAAWSRLIRARAALTEAEAAAADVIGELKKAGLPDLASEASDQLAAVRQ